MRTRVSVGLGIAGIFVGGLLAGALVSGSLPAFAAKSGATPSATGTPAATARTNYCATYEQALASELKISTSTLEKDNSAALQAVINQLYKDGKIDAQEQTKLNQQVTATGTSLCSKLESVIREHSGQRHSGQGALAGARQAVEAQVAPTLHLTTSQLDSDLKAGQTISQITSAQKANANDVKAAYLSAVKAQLAKAVSAKMLSQQQSDAIYQRFETAANSGRFPLLDHGDGAHGADKNAAGNAAGQAQA